MNKRGQSEIWEISTIFEIIIALIVASFFIMGATSYHQYTKFDKYYLEEEMKLLVNTVAASPGYTKFNYAHSKLYNINAKEKEVQVLRDLKFKNINEKIVYILLKEKPLGKIKAGYNE
ncbi:MAG: hypothetical protein U9Q69_02045 [Nanoarchaeota archaeon]|nr:hypothetical protein [Nanoarchaeota archaeon]